jgi:hypothetical protein
MACYFGLPASTFWWTWMKRPLLAILILTPVVLSTDWLASSAPIGWAQLLVASAWISLPAAIVFFLVALPRDVTDEITKTFPQFAFFGKR